MLYPIERTKGLGILVLALVCVCMQLSCKRIYDMRDAGVSECPIHHVKLQEAIVELDKRSIFTDEYLDASSNIFRYSYEKIYIGRWDSMPIEDYTRIEFCPKCREAEDLWLKNNPEHRPSVVHDSQIMNFRELDDQRKWRCSLHDEPLAWRLTAVRYDVHPSSHYVEAQKKLFPNSFLNVTVSEPRKRNSPQFAAMGFCLKCRDAEEKWCIQHPGECKLANNAAVQSRAGK